MAISPQDPKIKQVISKAFPGNEAPAGLSVGIVSLVELCNIAMPSAAEARKQIKNAAFVGIAREKADNAARLFALDAKILVKPVRNLRNALYARDRNDEAVLLLLSEGDTDDGRVVFLSSIFRGSIEADVVKAVTHVTKTQPFTGTTVTNADGVAMRRVQWELNSGGIRGMVVTGPPNVESLENPRAITAFNIAKA